MKYILFTSLLFMEIFLNCRSNSYREKVGSESVECKKFNDSGAYYISRYELNKDSAILDSALEYLKKATICDTNYFLAFSNELIILNVKKAYSESLIVTDKILTLSNNNPHYLFLKGILLDKLKNKDSAFLFYKEAESIYNKKLFERPNNTNLISDKLFLTEVLSGKEKAMSEMDMYLKKFPNDATLLFSKKILDSFNMDDFITGRFSNKP